MAKIFSKTTVVDEALDGDARYNILEDAGGAFKADMQIELATDVSIAGTDVNAALLNPLETAVDTLDDMLVTYTTGGTSTAFTLTTPQASALATDERWRVKFNATAGATPTLNRDAKGAKALKYYDNAGTKQSCGATTIISGIISDVVYDGTDYVLLDALPPAAIPDAASDSVYYGRRNGAWTNLKTYFDTLYAALTGNQTIAGIKTFSSFPVMPSSAPTTDYQVANKKYVDDNAGGGINPNALLNGGFCCTQRGAGPFISTGQFPNNDGAYLVDGWVNLSDGNDVFDVSVVADTDFVSGKCIKLDVETANKRGGIFQLIEQKDIQNIRKAGIASLQFKCKRTGTSVSNLRAYLLAWNSTADSPTKDCVSGATWGAAGADPTFVANYTTENTPANLALGTTIATHEIENITVDTSGVTNLGVLIIIDDTDASAGDFIYIGDVKLEAGATCTDFVVQDAETELSKCQRKLITYGTDGLTYECIGVGQAYTTTAANIALTYPVTMRAIPVVSYGTIGNYAVTNTTSSGIALTALSAVAVCHSSKVSYLGVTVAAGLVAGAQTQLIKNNNATDLLVFSAELGV